MVKKKREGTDKTISATKAVSIGEMKSAMKLESRSCHLSAWFVTSERQSVYI